MANISGSNSVTLASNVGGKFPLSVYFEETGTSTSGNTSTIYVSTTITGSGSSGMEVGNGILLELYWYDNNNNSGGKLVSSSYIHKIYASSPASLSSTITVTHKSDGSLSGYAKAVVTRCRDLGYEPNSGSTSTSNTALTKIPRYGTSNQSFNSKTETTIKMNWSSDSTVDYIWYSTNNGSSWTGVDVSDGTSGTYTIASLSANTTYTIKTRIRRKDSQLTTDSSSTSVTTYDYPYCTESPNFTLGNAVTLKFYNPLGRSFNFYIIGNGTQINTTYSCSSTSYSGVNSTSTSIPYLYATIPNAQSGQYQVKVVYGSSTKTRNNGNTYSINVNDCKPSFNDFSYSTDLSELTGNNETVINGKTTTTFTISSSNKATGTYSATIKKYRVECGSQSKEITFSTSDLSTTISNCTSSNVKITAIDSRGLERTVSKTITNYKAYVEPTFASIKLERKNGVDTESYMSLYMNYWNGNFGNGNNKLTFAVYRTKKKNESTYSSWFSIPLTSFVYSGDSVSLTNYVIHANGSSGGFSIGVAYEIQLKISDGLDSYTLETVASPFYPLTDGKVGLSLLKDSSGDYHAGINCMPNLSSPLAINEKTILDLIYPIGSIYMSVNSTDPKNIFGGTWTQLTNRFLIGAGSSYSVNATGGATSVTSGSYSGTSGSYSGTSGGPSNNTSGGPSNNTSGSTAITAAQMPSHNHQTYNTWGVKTGTGGLNYVAGVAADGFSGSGNYTNYTGSGQGHTHTLSSHTHSLSSHTHSIPSHTHSIPSHNHSVSTMPPYLAVYMWKRTA